MCEGEDRVCVQGCVCVCVCLIVSKEGCVRVVEGDVVEIKSE